MAPSGQVLTCCACAWQQRGDGAMQSVCLRQRQQQMDVRLLAALLACADMCCAVLHHAMLHQVAWC
jgi:hypothetical protein